MAMVCPQCAGAYDQHLQCPNCGVRLQYASRRPRPKAPAVPGRWQQTAWGRILIGLVLAQGLYFGLQHLLLGLVGLLHDQHYLEWTWTSLSGLIFLQVLQAFTLIAGGMLAGGGQQRGVMLGALVGVWNGVLAVLIEPLVHPQFMPSLTTMTMVGVPLVHIAFGTLGGWIGFTVWRPLRPDAPRDDGKPVRKAGVAPRRPLLAGRVAWFRVALGGVVAAAGYLTAAAIFNFLLDFSNGRLTSDGFWQDRVVTWEIQALAILIGGAVAGYNTANGLKQGACVGLLTSMALMVFLFNINRRTTPEVAALTVVGCFCLCLVGGWFGGQLFPPIVPQRSRRLDAAALT